MYKIAIVVIGYNRLNAISRLLDSISNAYYEHNDIPLIISIDKSETNSVELYADNFNWPYGEKIVVKHNENMGLRNHILSQGKWFDQYDALIILEEDLTVSPNFYTYATLTVDKYFNDSKIAGISLFSFGLNYQTGNLFSPIKDENDVYFMNCAQSWGEIWMKKQWLAFYEWYNSHKDFPTESDILPRRICQWKESSWLKHHTRYCIENNLFFVYPYTSYTTNNGDAGTHNHNATYININQERLQMGKITSLQLPDFVQEFVVCYDGFFENKNLFRYLGVDENDCCIDINNEKNKPLNKRFWLTSKRADYKIIKSYGIRLRPIDLNIVFSTSGTDLYLYDTSIVDKNEFKQNRFSTLLYDIRKESMLNILQKHGIQNLIHELCNKFINKWFRK